MKQRYCFSWKMVFVLMGSGMISGLIAAYWAFAKHEYSTRAIIIGFGFAFVWYCSFLILAKFWVDRKNRAISQENSSNPKK
jgi:ABC-type uncharacterized transport system permease subunit